MSDVSSEPCDHRWVISRLLGAYCSKCTVLWGWRGLEDKAPAALVRAGKARDTYGRPGFHVIAGTSLATES